MDLGDRQGRWIWPLGRMAVGLARFGDAASASREAWIIIVIIIRFEKLDFAGLARKRDMELGRVRGEYKMVSFYRVSSVISSPDPTQSKTGIVWGTRRMSWPGTREITRRVQAGRRWRTVLSNSTAFSGLRGSSSCLKKAYVSSPSARQRSTRSASAPTSAAL